jgi:hypothetical protein
MCAPSVLRNLEERPHRRTAIDDHRVDLDDAKPDFPYTSAVKGANAVDI